MITVKKNIYIDKGYIPIPQYIYAVELKTVLPISLEFTNITNFDFS